MRTALTSSFILQLIFCSIVVSQESPHGTIESQCLDCHTTNGWKVLVNPLTFDHSKTSFVLYGQHRNAECIQCHSSLRFAETSNQCIACHRKDYDAAISIDHRKAGFSTMCEQCHDVHLLSWQTSFDHDKTQFQTRGIHEAVPCNSCHVNNIFKGTPSECVACHLTEYQQAKDPDHTSANFSTDCAVCHRALTWQPAVFFPHDQYFQISAGATHRPGRWNTCGDCHTASPNYNSFECINCHEHSKASTDRRHGDVSGYVYQSSACYRCHSRV